MPEAESERQDGKRPGTYTLPFFTVFESIQA